MQTKLLKAYRKNPSRFKEILEIARHTDMDRSELLTLLREPGHLTKLTLAGAAGTLVGGLIGSVPAYFLLNSRAVNLFGNHPFIETSSKGELIESLLEISGGVTLPLLSLIFGGFIGWGMYKFSKNIKYGKLMKEANRNGYRSCLSFVEAGELSSPYVSPERAIEKIEEDLRRKSNTYGLRHYMRPVSSKKRK